MKPGIILAVILMLFSVPAALAQASLALPVRPGYYAESPATCAEAIHDENGTFVRARSMQSFDGVDTATRVIRGPSGEYTVTWRFEGDRGTHHTFTSKIRVVTPTSFVQTTNSGDRQASPESTTYRFCSPNAPQGW